jgi:hypothetical protein
MSIHVLGNGFSHLVYPFLRATKHGNCDNALTISLELSLELSLLVLFHTHAKESFCSRWKKCRVNVVCALGLVISD